MHAAAAPLSWRPYRPCLAPPNPVHRPWPCAKQWWMTVSPFALRVRSVPMIQHVCSRLWMHQWRKHRLRRPALHSVHFPEVSVANCVCVCFFFGGGEGINPIGMNNNQSYAKVVSRLKHDISLYFILAPNPGHVCLVHRGSCSFLLKAKHCSDAGAVGVIVVNGAGQSMVVMTGVCAQNDCPQYNSMPKIIHGISWLELRTSSKSKTAICSWNIIFQTNFWTGQGVQPFSAPGSILQQKPQATTLRSSSMA